MGFSGALRPHPDVLLEKIIFRVIILKYENSGRFIFFPKGGSGIFLRSRVSGLVKVNQWTHIAGTYDGTTTRLYINGVLDTSRTGITGNLGSNFDSLFIGCDIQISSPAFFFNGRLDNVRIWKSARTASELLDNMFIPLNIYQLSGAYSFLAASYQFDNSAADISGPAQNNGFERNISYINYSNKAVNQMDYNNSLILNGSSYCSHYNIGDPDQSKCCDYFRMLDKKGYCHQLFK